MIWISQNFTQYSGSLSTKEKPLDNSSHEKKYKNPTFMEFPFQEGKARACTMYGHGPEI